MGLPPPFSELKASTIDGLYEVDCDLFWSVCPPGKSDRILKARPYRTKPTQITLVIVWRFTLPIIVSTKSLYSQAVIKFHISLILWMNLLTVSGYST